MIESDAGFYIRLLTSGVKIEIYERDQTGLVSGLFFNYKQSKKHFK